MSLKHAAKLDLGCGGNKYDGCIGVDIIPMKGVDVCCEIGTVPWPFRDDVALKNRLDNVIEHRPDTVAVFNEVTAYAHLVAL